MRENRHYYYTMLIRQQIERMGPQFYFGLIHSSFVFQNLSDNVYPAWCVQAARYVTVANRSFNSTGMIIAQMQQTYTYSLHSSEQSSLQNTHGLNLTRRLLVRYSVALATFKTLSKLNMTWFSLFLECLGTDCPILFFTSFHWPVEQSALCTSYDSPIGVFGRF